MQLVQIKNRETFPAVQYNGTNDDELIAFAKDGSVVHYIPPCYTEFVSKSTVPEIFLKKLHPNGALALMSGLRRPKAIRPGDWILKSNRKDYYRLVNFFDYIEKYEVI